MKTLTYMAVAAALSAGTLLADDPQWQMQRDTQRRERERAQAEYLERAPTVALYVRDRGVGRRATTERDTPDRAVIQQQGRGERTVIRPTPQ